ncbi:glycoside hydrolase family 12 protein [Parathielavia appendiculata]|uniref:Glycoside hydrolase family 12 protein n=1 Tax=Parathielavia appendiculata TaxID=2587402 RepID=A0AAN6TYT7_9PEZI|nr:glycoside hydrolase family 12 protein [Parathielavia appendiculata]
MLFAVPPCDLLTMRYTSSPIHIIAMLATWTLAAYDEKLCNVGSYTSRDNALIYVPNAWNDDGDGFSCVAVRDSPPAFDATWKWSSGPESVKSYPHVKLTDPTLPVPLSNISAFTLSAQWAMGPGSTPWPVPSIDWSGLASIDVSANTAFDIFADRNPDNAQNETEAETEIMIWLGKVGYAQPLGYGGIESYRAKVTVGHTEFVLYHGKNQRGTAVFTWVAGSNETSFADDVSPLLNYLWRNGLVSPASHVGAVGFGSETYYAAGNVTFSSSRYGVNVLPGPAPTLVLAQTPTGCTPSEAVSSEAVSSEAVSSEASLAARIQASWLSGVSIIRIVGASVVLLF